MLISRSIQGYCFAVFIALVGVKSGISQTANFSISVPSQQGCSPLTVNFTDISFGGTVATRTWDLGNGTSVPPLVTVGANYIVPQKYYITLTVTFTNGITSTKLDSITVHPKPIANFVSTDTIGCAPHTANFTSTSSTPTGFINYWQWDFGAGGITGPSNPSFVFNASGLYQVSLIVRNNWGCQSDAATKPQYIKVFPPPVAAFTMNPTFSCKDTLTVNFTNTTTNGDPSRNTYEWNFGDGSPLETTKDATHFFAAPGNYIVRLTVRLGNNCVSTTTRTVYVGKPTPAFGIFPNEVCANNATTFTGTGTPNTSFLKWVFTDNGQVNFNSPVSHTFANAGTYEVQLIAFNAVGCSDTIRRDITVKPGPVILFTPDTFNSACKPQTVTFANNTAGDDLKFFWNYGDGSPIDSTSGPVTVSHTYLNFGTYTVTVLAKDTSVPDGCSATRTFSFIRIAPPNVNFTYVPPSGCRPLPVNFTAQVTGAIVPVLSYTWNFGDGSPPFTSTTNTAFHLYGTAGVFNVSVTVTMQGGCTYTSVLKPVTVIDICIDDGSGGGAGGGGFILGKTCSDKYTVTFNDTVSNSVVISWDFGDGTFVNTGILNPIVHTYSPPQKVFLVTLTRLDTITNIITVAQKNVIIIDEKANFAPNITDICKDKNVLFNTIGIDSSLIRRYTWDFGDGTPRLIINNAAYFASFGIYLNGNTNHTYTSNGVFFVKLIIEDKLGCLDSIQYPVPITVQGPIAGFIATPLTSCASPFPVSFADTSIQNGSTPITEWQWTFGDGSPLFTQTVDTAFMHVYNGPSFYNAYNVTLKITDAIGCDATVTKPAYIKIYKPVANFFSNDTLKCNSYNVFLFNTSSAFNATYKWYYGDGTSSTGFFGSHTYTADGIYDIKLVVTDENGCKDSITKPSYVKLVKPKADFSIQDTLLCAPAAITFKDSSQYARTYQWDFGDGGTGSTQKDPAPHIYGTPGFYNVKLKITGPNGCVDSTVKQIRVRGPIGTLSVTGSQGCRPYNVNMKVTGSFISTYAWDFGDGTPVIPNAVDSLVDHIYQFAGKYVPNVVLVSPEGCPYTLKVTDTIFVDSLKVSFAVGQNVFCENGASQTVTFTNTSVVPGFSNILTSFWNWGDGQTEVNNASTVTHNYTNYGTYNVYLVVTTKYGCRDTFFMNAAVRINPKPAVSIIGGNTYCLTSGSTLQFNSNIISLDAITRYRWKIDNDSVANTPNLNIDYRIQGSHIVKFWVQTVNGCTDSASFLFFIDSVRAAFAHTPAQSCGPATVTFTNQSVYANGTPPALLWSFGDNSFNNSNFNTSHLYGSTGTYNVKLLLQTPAGCRDSVEKIAAVIIDSIPKPTIFGNPVYCLTPNSLVNFTSNIITVNPVVKYKWKIDADSAGNTPNLSVNYRIPGNHIAKLIVTTDRGCTDSAAFDFIIDSVVAGFVNLPIQSCGPANVLFTNQTTSFSPVQNILWNFGDGTTSGVSSPSHQYNFTGSYNVKLLMVNNNGCTDSVVKIAAVVIDSIPRPSIIGDSIHCSPGVHTYSGNVVTIDAIQVFEWRVNGNVAGNSANLTYNFAPGTYNISLKVTSSKGCTASVSRTILIDSLLSDFAIANPEVCGTPATISFSQQGFASFGVTSYLWNFGNANTANNTLANPSSVYNNSGTYQVNLTITSTTGCTKLSTSKNVIIYPGPALIINSVNSACAETNIQFTAGIVSQDAIITKEWKVNNVLAGTGDVLQYLFAIAGNYTVSFRVVTLNGCDVTVVKNIVISPLPVPNAGPNTSVCLSNSVQLSAGGGIVYSWSPLAGLNNATSPNPVATPVISTKYYVTVTNSFGCQKLDSVFIQVDNPVSLVPPANRTICEGASTQLNATSNATTYLWSPPTGLSNPAVRNPVASPAITTTYRLIAFSANVCKNDTAFVTVAVDPTPTVRLGNDTTVIAGTTIRLDARASSNVVNYTWLPITGLNCSNCPTPEFTADKTINYKVTVSTFYGCTATDDIVVTVLCNKGAIYIPNAFTPNGDGLNDRFGVRGYGIAKVKRFAVFNRWGELVFERKDYLPSANDVFNTWDGREKGKTITSTVAYVYIVEVECVEGTVYFIKDMVTLIK